MHTARRLLVLSAVLLPALVAVPAAPAADILVPQDAATIQAGIDLAADGDRVLVAPGTYPERIDFTGKAIILEATGGPEATIIDGGGEEAGAGHTVTIADSGADGAVLRGFTITGGFGSSGSFGAGEGGGILVTGAAPLIEDCRITDNRGIDGAGLEVRGGDVRVVASVFEANAGFVGGGLYAQGGRITVERSDFLANTASNDGGGVAILWQTEAVLTEVRLERNHSLQFGGGLYANHADLDLSWLTLEDNGLVEPTDDGVGQVFSTLGGGGMYVTSVSGRLDASRFEENDAAFGAGAYIAGGSENFTVSNSLFARSNGTGSLYFNASSPHVVNCTVAEPGGFLLPTFSTFGALPVLKNTVLQGTPGGSGEARLEYCLVEGSAGVGIVGEGTIFGDVDLDPDNDYTPRAGSLAIDAGNNLAVPEGATTDVLGNERFFDDPDTPDTGQGTPPIVDIGAVEFGSGVEGGEGGITAAGDAPAALLASVRATPNPFNPRTEIRFALDRAASVRIDIHDARGRRVDVLRPGPLPAGPQAVAWDGTGRDGRALATGVYLAVVRADQARQTLKMTLVR
jgi:hypothetical protein